MVFHIMSFGGLYLKGLILGILWYLCHKNIIIMKVQLID